MLFNEVTQFAPPRFFVTRKEANAKFGFLNSSLFAERKNRREGIGAGKINAPVIVKRKPRDSRVVQKRLTDEQNDLLLYNGFVTCQLQKKYNRRLFMKKEISVDSLAHTKWDCKYHIVFAPKYRRKVFFENKRLEIR